MGPPGLLSPPRFKSFIRFDTSCASPHPRLPCNVRLCRGETMDFSCVRLRLLVSQPRCVIMAVFNSFKRAR